MPSIVIQTSDMHSYTNFKERPAHKAPINENLWIKPTKVLFKNDLSPTKLHYVLQLRLPVFTF